ncbi:MAG: BrnT family toxin [Chloroflexi bacterium]|nr:BrnT family toxin [Chloroflexota bacterium]
MFFDPFLVVLDDEITAAEERHTVIGLTTHCAFCMVYAWRGEAIRLISARIATSHERKIYEHDTA